MSAEGLTWVDGERLDSLPLPDRGLAFGDGLFETLLLLNGGAILADYHRERLAAGLRALDFPESCRGFDEALDWAAVAAPPGPAALRVTVTRGGGPRGYAPPAQARPRVIAQLSPLSRDVLAWPGPASLGVASIAWPSQPRLAGHKHLNRLEQVLAAAEYTRNKYDEALMLDQSGAPVSVVAGNLFALIDGRLRTPALRECGVAGTRRRAVIELWAPAAGLSVEEGPLGLEELQAASELFFCNSLLGIRAVGRLREQRWSGHAVTRAIHDSYRQYLERLL